MWKILEGDIVSEKFLSFLFRLGKWSCVGKLFYFFLYWKLEFIHELIYIFSSCITDVLLEIKEKIS